MKNTNSIKYQNKSKVSRSRENTLVQNTGNNSQALSSRNNWHMNNIQDSRQ